MAGGELRAWGVQWYSRNRVDGESRHLQWQPVPDGCPGDFILFRTRAQCRAYIDQHYGYIRERPDLLREPHGWRVPRAVRVKVVLDG